MREEYHEIRTDAAGYVGSLSEIFYRGNPYRFLTKPMGTALCSVQRKNTEKFDDNAPSVYNLCRKDYPDLLAELISEPCKDILDCGPQGLSAPLRVPEK